MSTILGQTRKPFGRPAYQYIRTTDKLPHTTETPEWPTCTVKLFNPNGAGTWYIAGFDPESGVAFGVADIHEPELGYFDVNELVAYRGRFGLPVERDLYWTPTPAADLLR
jgi:hypothetical protein